MKENIIVRKSFVKIVDTGELKSADSVKALLQDKITPLIHQTIENVLKTAAHL